MKCYMCDWSGHPNELVAITDEPESINDFVHCPICRNNVWMELSDANDSDITNKKGSTENGRSQ